MISAFSFLFLVISTVTRLISVNGLLPGPIQKRDLRLSWKIAIDMVSWLFTVHFRFFQSKDTQ